MVRNPIGWRERLARLRGEPIQFDLAAFDEPLQAVRRAADAWEARLDDEIEAGGLALNALSTPDLCGGVVALARRRLGVELHDEQIVAGLAMAAGAIVEMQTGEGKTVSATIPAVLWAVERGGVHILTFNDYLAARDVQWMGPIYQGLGLTVRAVQQGMDATARRASYRADVTYVTAKEAGFDRLRDLTAVDLGGVVHRPLQAAIVDEADSLLIDEARVPLVLAGATGTSSAAATQMLAAVVAALDSTRDFVVDEHGRNVELTDDGLARVERALGRRSLHEEGDQALLSQVNCALHARALLQRERDYLVRHGRIELIDEMTGRTAPDRRWPEGLQSALEAKEGLDPSPEGEVLASMTLQRYLRSYPRLAGMTGTARDAAAELFATYGRRVVVIPTHRPVRRVDHPDVVFAGRQSKERAVAEEVVRAHATGQPVLVGTRTVEESERVAKLVKARGVPCQVLNAAQDAAEAHVVARAGERGAVTIATNMAGRGTDIKLGGPDERDHAAVAALGGLYVIGTNRHESRRVDRQLRGRAGRQGDPGETRFFVSLEDDLLTRHGSLGSLLAREAVPGDDQRLDNPVVRREIARAQRIIEGQHSDIRRTLAEYAAVVEEQFDVIVTERREWLEGRADVGAWRNEPAYGALVASVAKPAVEDAERRIRLGAIDREWRRHLALCADVREGAHLARLGGGEPLAVYTTAVLAAFAELPDRVDTATREALSVVEVRAGRLELSAAVPPTPTSTWTYLVNDDPFRHTIGTLLTGPGGHTKAIYAAALLGPLLALWGAVSRWWPRRRVGASRR